MLIFFLNGPPKKKQRTKSHVKCTDISQSARRCKEKLCIENVIGGQIKKF